MVAPESDPSSVLSRGHWDHCGAMLRAQHLLDGLVFLSGEIPRVTPFEAFCFDVGIRRK